MPEKEGNLGRKASLASNYDNPALFQIMQRLSELPYQKDSKDGGTSHPWTSQHRITSTDNLALAVAADREEDISMSGTKYPSLKPSNKPHVLPTRVVSDLESSSWLPHPNSDDSINHFPTKHSATFGSKVNRPIPDRLATLAPKSPLPNDNAYSSLKEDRSIRHSSESLDAASGTWPGSPCTIESSDIPTHPIRQPKGPQHFGHDKGFDWDAYHRIRSHSKTSSRSLDENPFVSQTEIPSPVRQMDRKTTKYCPELQNRPVANNSTQQYLPTQTLSPRTSVQYGPLDTFSASRNVSLDLRTSPGQTNNVYQPVNMSPGVLGHSARSSLSVSSRQAATMREGQKQLHHQNSAMTSPKQMALTKPFIPSTMALTEAGVAVRDPARMPLGSKYQGDAFSQSYLRQVPDLPDHFNTSLWLKGLPPGVHPSRIFDMIQCGSVWSLDLKPTTEQHATVAATLTFMTPYAASLFLGRCRFHGLQLDGYWISASYNKFGIPAISTKESRVLHIEGPAHLMTPEGWETQFKKACRFQMDRWSYLPCPTPGRLRMEFRFVRVDGQAQSCRQMIERELGYLGVTVWYGMDPCGQFGY